MTRQIGKALLSALAPAPIRVSQTRPSLPKEVNWSNVAFLTLSPIAAIVGVTLYVLDRGLHPGDLVCFASMLWLSGLAITAGYHRYYSHRSYKCRPAVRVFYLLFGAAALENSVLIWASNHRYHHRFVDQGEDPHDITRGRFWAYMGWAFYRKRSEPSLENVADLTSDRMAAWQHRYYLPLGIVVGFVLPLLLGLSIGRPLGGFLWGGLFRAVVLHHITFFFNLAGHSIGRRPYSNEDSSRDSAWLSLLGFGEGYHNFHHAFPGDYRSGVAWYHWDPTKWWIWGLSLAGLTSRLNRTSERSILKARRQTASTQLFLERQSDERTDQCP